MDNLNILPPKYRKKFKIKFSNPTYGLLILIVTLFSLFFINVLINKNISTMENNINIAKQEKVKKESQNKIKENKIEELKRLKEEIDSLYKTEEDNSKTNSDSINKNITKNNIKIYKLLDEISYYTPSEVVIVNIKDKGNNIIQIDAVTTTLGYMAKMEESFKNNKKYFKNVKLDNNFKYESFDKPTPDYNVSFSLFFEFVN